MDVVALKPRLSDSAAVVLFIDPRLLRRVIKRHLRLPGLGLAVPHARSYVLSREALLSIVDLRELGCLEGSLPAEVILLPRPTRDELAGATPAEARRELWRSTFHARIHLEIERRLAALSLTPAMLRERIHRIGQTEFDEIRLVLRHDDLLLPPYDTRATYAEFAALYLELRHFSPAHLERMFPTLHDRARVDAALACDLDARALLESCRPEGEAPADEEQEVAPSFLESAGGSDVSAPSEACAPVSPPAFPIEASASDPAAVARRFAAADAARARGNAVRAALLRLGALALATPSQAEAAREGIRADLQDLADRLGNALSPSPERAAPASAAGAWTPILLALAERGGARRRLRNTVEVRLLYDLQRAAVARERPLRAVRLLAWVLSLGRRPGVRELPATTEVRIVRYVHRAFSKLGAVRLAAAERARLAERLREARACAEENLRRAFRPQIQGALVAVGLRPENAPERVALGKLTEELLDHVIAHGFIGIGHLRDALSRNQLKLPNLSGVGELLRGDALIKADRRLKGELEGVYRGGEIYLRGLQKLSSVAFGTRPGRFLTRYLVLPLGAAFVLLEGLSHIVGPLAKRLGYGEVELFSRASFLITAALIFSLLHSATVRGAALWLLGGVGAVLAAIFFRFPRWIAALPLVRRIVESRVVRLTARWLVKPAVIAAGVVFFTPLRALPPERRLGAAAAIFAIVSGLVNSRLGSLAEELAVDWIVRQWSTLRRRILPGLFRLIADTSRTLLDLFERAIYRIDELLRFREGEGTLTLVGKAALGTVWAALAYLVRIYINLLIEPQINPIKHFPVVTVSHKIMIPFFPTLVRAFAAPLRPLGPALAGSIAGTTVLLLPGVFGFLVWELKENFRLYQASRPEHLEPLVIGHHGETMEALMKPGFHSGTLPKLYAKLRRAALRGDASLARHQQALHEVVVAVEQFVDRELSRLLAGAARFRYGPVEVRGARIASNRVQLELVCTGLSPEPCWIAFDEQAGLILASVPSPGWVAALPEPSRTIFENALAGLYQLAGVDLVREQIDASLCRATGAPRAPPYDLSAEGLVIWPAQGSAAEAYRTEVVIPLAGGAGRAPVVRGEPLAEAPRVDVEELLYRHQRIRWVDWVAAWAAAESEDAPIPRLVRGASILPPRARGDA